MSEKSELVCGECGARLGVGEWKGRIITKCPYCGCDKLFREDPRIVAERIKSNRISSIENRRLDIEELKVKIDKRRFFSKLFEHMTFWKFLYLLLLTLIAFILVMNISSGIRQSLESRNMIDSPEDSSYYVGKDFRVVERSLKDAGFTNVSSVPIYDDQPSGSVDHVTIGGKSDFSHWNSFDKSIPVVVYYHAEKVE